MAKPVVGEKWRAVPLKRTGVPASGIWAEVPTQPELTVLSVGVRYARCRLANGQIQRIPLTQFATEALPIFKKV